MDLDIAVVGTNGMAQQKQRHPESLWGYIKANVVNGCIYFRAITLNLFVFIGDKQLGDDDNLAFVSPPVCTVTKQIHYFKEKLCM